MSPTMSPPVPGPQFQVTDGRITNLDRCNECGAPRSAHGIDWSCPPPMAGNVRLYLVGAGLALLVAGGILWDVSRTGVLNTVAAMAIPLGLALLVVGSIMPSQQGAIRPPGRREIYHSRR